MDFLNNRQQQHVWLGQQMSNPRSTKIGDMLSPFLYSLYANNCTSNNRSIKLIKYFAEDTTLLGLIKGNDESAAGSVEMVIDFRRGLSPTPNYQELYC